MTKAPDRIWAVAEIGTVGTGRWVTQGRENPHGNVEYHRADLTAAAVAAALQGAAEQMDAGFSYNAGNRVRAQIDPTGLAALKARDAQVRSEALEEAARLSEKSVMEGGMGKSPAFFLRVGEWEAYKNACLSYAAAIRAMAKPTAKEGGEG